MLLLENAAGNKLKLQSEIYYMGNWENVGLGMARAFKINSLLAMFIYNIICSANELTKYWTCKLIDANYEIICKVVFFLLSFNFYYVYNFVGQFNNFYILLK